MALVLNTNPQTLIELKKLTMVQFSSLWNTITNVNLWCQNYQTNYESIFELVEIQREALCYQNSQNLDRMTHVFPMI